VRDDIRITRTAWLNPAPESKWIYDRMQRVVRTLNDRSYQFDLSGFSEHLQYAVYHAAEGGHFDWHVDQGRVLQSRRKLSISVQLSDPAQYEGCDLQFYAGNKIETAPRDRGAVIAFPSFVLHRVTPCVKGHAQGHRGLDHGASIPCMCCDDHFKSRPSMSAARL
jgi:PKHD-type hydroxylase